MDFLYNLTDKDMLIAVAGLFVVVSFIAAMWFKYKILMPYEGLKYEGISAQATVTDKRKVRNSHGGHNQIDYFFTDYKGNSFEGTSGVTAEAYKNYNKDEIVEVKYLRNKPSVNDLSCVIDRTFKSKQLLSKILFAEIFVLPAVLVGLAFTVFDK